MFREHEIILSEGKDTVITKLNGQVRHSFITDKVENDSFSIHRSLANSPQGSRRSIEFCFNGTVSEDPSGVIVKYRIMPSIIWIIVFVIFSMTGVITVISALINRTGDPLLFLSIVVPVALYIYTALECRECRSRFENKLRE